MLLTLTGRVWGHEKKDALLSYILNDPKMAQAYKKNLEKRKKLRKKKIYQSTIYDHELMKADLDFLEINIIERRRRLETLIKHWRVFKKSEETLGDLDILDNILTVEEIRQKKIVKRFKIRIEHLGEKAFWAEENYLLWKLKNGKANKIDKMLLQTKYKK